MGVMFRQRLVIGAAVVVVFVAYSFFPWITTRFEPVKFNSPDEAASYFFAARLSQAERLDMPELLNGLAGNLIHPRSTEVVNGGIVPGSFLGLPLLYGTVGLTFGIGWLPFLTPLAAVGLLAACFFVWRRMVGKSLALLATVLLAFHPALWYYTSRGLYHNVLFAALLALAALSYIRFREEGYRPGWVTVSALAFAGAFVVRTSEALWVAPLIAAAVLADRKSWRLVHVVSAVVPLGLVAVGWLYLSTVMYGQPMPPGYPTTGAVAGFHPRLWLRTLSAFLLPFGFNLRAIAGNAWSYGVVLFWPYWLLAAVGLLVKRGRLLPRWYTYGSLWVTLWLLMYYGSWDIRSTLLAPGPTLGASYVRYWIPIYLVWLPFAAAAIATFAERLPELISRRLALTLTVMVLGFASFSQVFFEPYDGLYAVAERLGEYRATSRMLERLTTADAVIIGDRVDKIAFPERRVIVSDGRPVLTIPEVRAVLPSLTEHVPTYYITVSIPDRALGESLVHERFRLVAPAALPDRSWLFRLVRL